MCFLFICFTDLVKAQENYKQCGQVSWYHLPNKKTASGNLYTTKKLTAAHRSLPFGTKLKLRYNNKIAIVEINDRGPFVKNRILDVNKKVANLFDFKNKGVVKMCFEKIN